MRKKRSDVVLLRSQLPVCTWSCNREEIEITRASRIEQFSAFAFQKRGGGSIEIFRRTIYFRPRLHPDSILPLWPNHSHPGYVVQLSTHGLSDFLVTSLFLLCSAHFLLILSFLPLNCFFLARRPAFSWAFLGDFFRFFLSLVSRPEMSPHGR